MVKKNVLNKEVSIQHEVDIKIDCPKVISELSTNPPPWLKEVSDDGTKWVIIDLGGENNRIETIDFNVYFPDRTKLVDDKNSSLYSMAKAYAYVYRLYAPQSSAGVHKQRVNSLIYFFYWMRLNHVYSLKSITREHTQLYAEKAALGMSLALDIPQRFYEYIVQFYCDNENHINTLVNTFDRTALLKAANVSLRDTPRIDSCTKAILDFVQGLDEKLTKLPPFEYFLKSSKLKPTPITIQHIHRLLLPIEELWLMRSQLPDTNLEIQPFFKQTSQIALQLGAKPKRHRTIPPRLALEYLSRALIWVTTYAPIIIAELNSTSIDFRKLNQLLSEAGFDVEILNNQKLHNNNHSISLKKLVQYLSTACFILIAGFTARRLNEINDLEVDCVKKDMDGHDWLVIYIEKTLKRYEQIPIPSIVQKAIMVMENVSSSARQNTKTDSIWLFQHDKKLYKLQPHELLNDFAARESLTEMKDPPWNFTAHQLRRFFAVLYFWRYEKGDLAAISHHLRHFDLEMTKRYVTDNEFGKVWMEVEEEWQKGFLTDVISGSRQIGGKAGQRLKKEADKYLKLFRRSVDVITIKRATEKLLRLSKKWGSEYKQHVWGTICACPKNTKISIAANCKGSRQFGPDFSNADVTKCMLCSFAIHTENLNSSAESTQSLFTNNLTSVGGDTIFSEFAQARVLSLEAFLNNAESFPTIRNVSDEQ